MNCNGTTVKQFFECAGKSFGLQDGFSCETRVCYLNMVLNHLFLDTFMLDANIQYETFTGDGIKDFVTSKPVLQIENFYGLGNSRAFSLEKRECDTCGECGEQEKIIQMFEVGPSPGVKPCQFYKRCKTIKANIPNGVTSGYIKYYAGYNKIVSEDEIMPVDDDLFPALHMLLAYYTAPITGDSTQQDKAGYINDYNIYINKILFQYSKRPGRSFNFIGA